jgi:hypothetical protein
MQLCTLLALYASEQFMFKSVQVNGANTVGSFAL